MSIDRCLKMFVWTLPSIPTQVVAQMTFDGHILELGDLLGLAGKRKELETPLLLLLHRRAIRVDLVAERLGRQVLVLTVDQSDGVGPHFELDVFSLLLLAL